jgi:phosphate transport system substrate-binding protein
MTGFRIIGLFIGVLGMLMVAAFGCNESASKDMRDTPNSGSITISVDESFKPVIDSQIQVFESQFPAAHINVQYKPEADCIKDLNNDSVRMVIITRGLTQEEQDLFKKKLTYVPQFGPIAFDAIAAVVNSKSKDTVFTMQDIRSLIKGTSGYKYKVLLDGLTATSTVRFVMDSLAAGSGLSKNVVASKSSEELINYVSQNDDALGLVGVSWVGNRQDPQVLSFLENVKIAAIECRGCNGTYVQPYQANIATGRYPMIRPLYYILKENYNGLGSGFKNFLIYEKGQLIFRRAFLLPARMKFEVRTIDINE